MIALDHTMIHKNKLTIESKTQLGDIGETKKKYITTLKFLISFRDFFFLFHEEHKH